MANLDHDLPNVNTGVGDITLRVREHGGLEVLFKLKKDAEMTRLFSAYATRKNTPAKSFKFLYEGKRVGAKDTSKLLEMEEDDQVDVVIEQVGAMWETITLYVLGQDGDTVGFKMKKSQQLQIVFDEYATRRAVKVDSLRFLYSGKILKGTMTPEMLDMQEHEQIDAFAAVKG